MEEVVNGNPTNLPSAANNGKSDENRYRINKVGEQWRSMVPSIIEITGQDHRSCSAIATWKGHGNKPDFYFI
jgi:hypothetical protein